MQLRIINVLIDIKESFTKPSCKSQCFNENQLYNYSSGKHVLQSYLENKNLTDYNHVNLKFSAYRELSWVLCDDPYRGRMRAGGTNGVSRGGGYLYTYSWILMVVQHTLTQHCKAIILKKKKIQCLESEEYCLYLLLLDPLTQHFQINIDKPKFSP